MGARPLALSLGTCAVLLLSACAGSSEPKPAAQPQTGTRPVGGDAIAFVSNRDGDYAIFVMNVKGGRQHRLTKASGNRSSPATLYFQDAPAWSPDGRRIAFASARSGNSGIYVMNADGTGTRRLTSGPQENTPSWSPDGKRIAFTRGGRDVYVINADGSGARVLTRDPARDYDPAWSPDGTRIAFVRTELGSAAIFTVRPDGSGLRRLTQLTAVDYSPAWSPDGRRIAYSSSAGAGFDIHVVNADGSGHRNLTRAPGDDFHPSWSPDGKRIAFARDAAIYVMRSDGSQQRRLTDETIDDSPAWQPLAQP